MTTTPEAEVAALLRQAEAAHGEYETTVLGGVYDEDWPRWYAAYLLEHGLADHPSITGRTDAEALAATLKRLADDYERERPAEPWPDVYAQRLLASP